MPIAEASDNLPTTYGPGLNPGQNQSGSWDGHDWSSFDQTITWPTHQLVVRSNISDTMPGWNPAWAHGSSSSSASKRQIGTGPFAHVINKCGFPIYAHTSIGANAGVTGDEHGADSPSDANAMIRVSANGGTYQSGFQAVVNGGGGVSVKLGMASDAVAQGNIYQIEYAEQAKSAGQEELYYDLSHVNGDPFIGYARFLQISTDASACQNIYNAPNSNSADWPNAPGCTDIQDLYFYLCWGGKQGKFLR
jgi:hypothetical protein